MNSRMLSRTGPCPQLQAGETGTKECLMMSASRQAIGTAFTLLIIDILRIAHCLELSLAETPKNEDLLIAACHFWSNGANALLFGHGPMSPTLAVVYMITGLEVTGTVYLHKYKGSSRQIGVRTGVGYKRYIQNYMSDGPLSDVEYRAFLNMWLCRFIFCGKANEPTLNHIVMAEDLAAGTSIPLGKYLLGSVYHMLH
jgi:hypothetical protein